MQMHNPRLGRMEQMDRLLFISRLTRMPIHLDRDGERALAILRTITVDGRTRL